MQTLSVVEGLWSAWLLAGAAAVSVPLLLHLLRRRPARTIELPTARFLQAAISATAAPRRLREVALLAVRAIALLLIAAAFARPVWIERDAIAAPEDGEALVLIIDASASMMRMHAGSTLFDQARRAALRELEGIQTARNRAGVILARRSPEALLPALTTDIAVLRSVLERAEATLERAELVDALRTAAALQSGGALRILVFSDMQRTAWDSLAAQQFTLDERIAVELRSVSQQRDEGNLAIIDMALNPANPMAGEEAILTVTATNFSHESVEALVTVDAGDGAVAQPVRIHPWGEATVTSPLHLLAPGVQAIRARVDDARFAHDDERFLIVDAADRGRLLIVTGTDAAAGASAAIAALEAAPVESARVHIADVARLDAERYDAVVLIGAGVLDEGAMDSIAERVRRGEALLWFIDSFGAATAAGAWAARWGDALPLPLAMAPQMEPGAAVSEIGIDGEAMPGLARSAPRAIRALRFGERPAASLRGSGRTLAQYEDGAPFVAVSMEQSLGAVAMVSGCLSADDGAAVRSPALPVLISDLTRWLTMDRTAPRRSAHVGEEIEVISAADLAAVRLPLRTGRRSDVSIESAPGGLRVRIPPAPAPGLEVISDRDGRMFEMVSVALDPAESDLRTLSDEEAQRLFIQTSLAHHHAEGVTAAPAAAELWPFLLLAALLLLAAEPLLALTHQPRDGRA